MPLFKFIFGRAVVVVVGVGVVGVVVADVRFGITLAHVDGEDGKGSDLAN